MRVGKIIPIATVENPLEVIQSRKHHASLRPRVTFEFNIECLTDCAASAICANQVIPGNPLAAIYPFNCYSNGIPVLADCCCASIETHVRVRIFAESGDPHVCELMLLGLHHERKFRLITQEIVIEFADSGACRPVPELKVACNKPLGDKLADQPQPVDHLERRRMGGRCTRTLVYGWLSLKQDDREPFLGGGKCSNNADRPRANHDDTRPFHLNDCPGRSPAGLGTRQLELS